MEDAELKLIRAVRREVKRAASRARGDLPWTAPVERQQRHERGRRRAHPRVHRRRRGCQPRPRPRRRRGGGGPTHRRPHVPRRGDHQGRGALLRPRARDSTWRCLNSSARRATPRTPPRPVHATNPPPANPTQTQSPPPRATVGVRPRRGTPISSRRARDATRPRTTSPNRAHPVDAPGRPPRGRRRVPGTPGIPGTVRGENNADGARRGRTRSGIRARGPNAGRRVGGASFHRQSRPVPRTPRGRRPGDDGDDGDGCRLFHARGSPRSEPRETRGGALGERHLVRRPAIAPSGVVHVRLRVRKGGFRLRRLRRLPRVDSPHRRRLTRTETTKSTRTTRTTRSTRTTTRYA